ncbi:MAG: DUF5666 domain-containing protein [Gammaproteobacteria bacterium]
MLPRTLLTKCLPMVLVVGFIGLGVKTTSAGIQGSGFRRLATFGVITSTGDITVNDIPYKSARSRVNINGHVSDESHLHVGQVVTIEGSIDPSETTAIADEISYNADLQGPITFASSDAQTLTVLGHTVRITASTVVEGQSSEGLSPGQLVEVSGYPNAAGEFVASRVSVDPHTTGAQVHGTVSALDQNAQTFLVGSLLVDYATANVAGLLAEDVDVVVQGGVSDGAHLLVANRVTVTPPLGRPGESVDLESIITSFASAAEFELNGWRIRGDEKTKYGLHGGTLGPNATVRVKGKFAADGTVIADKIDLVPAKKAAKRKAKT